MSETNDTANPKGVQIIRGLPFMDLRWFTKENIEAALDYKPHDGDIIIAAYPKTGSTWLQYIVHQIMSKGDIPPSMHDIQCITVPLIEITGIEAIEMLKEPRIYKQHLLYSLKNPRAKYLYIYRNPEDIVVSYYHFMNSLMEEDLEIEQFFEGFMVGNIGYGRYFEHILSYLMCVERDKILFISYEKLTSNKVDEILRVAKFIGERYYQDIVDDESVMKRILEHTTFDYMKKNLTVRKPGSEEDKVAKDDSSKKINFFRKGAVGDGKSMLSSEQLERMRQLMKELMKGTYILEEWLDQQ